MTLRAKLTRLSARQLAGLAVGCALTASVLIGGTVVIEQRQAAAPIPSPPAGSSSGPSGHGAAVQLDFATVPDGKIPDHLGNVTLSTIEGGRNISPMLVLNGQLRHGAPMDSDSSSDLVAGLAAPVVQIGATIIFPPYGGSVALAAWDSRPGADAKPNAGIHVVVGPDRWEMSVWDANAGRDVLAQGNYKASRPGIPQSFQATRADSTMTLTMPDGQQHSVTDPRVAKWAGNYATWELYETQPGVTPASVSSLWAT